MNIAADPAFVAAEVAYRFERGHIISPPPASARRREHRLSRWLGRMTHRSTARRHSRSRHA